MGKRKNSRVFMQQPDGSISELPEAEANRLVAEYDARETARKREEADSKGYDEYHRILALSPEERTSFEQDEVRQWRYEILSLVATLEQVDRRSPEERAASRERNREDLRASGWSEE